MRTFLNPAIYFLHHYGNDVTIAANFLSVNVKDLDSGKVWEISPSISPEGLKGTHTISKI